jgi:hypothetical protein
MPLDDFFANGKADTCARVLLPGVEPLKDHKDALGIFRVDADAIVSHREPPHFSISLASHVDFRRPLALVFDRVAD